MKEIKLRDNHISSKRYKMYITTCGKVFKLDTRNNQLTEMNYNIAHGYKRIRIKDIKTNQRRYYRVSRLVGEAFIENPYNKEVINHKDGNKLNNAVQNLEWATIAENTKHAYDNNLVHDRGGWKNHPYKERYGNTEGLTTY
jgi:hypothetical protein